MNRKEYYRTLIRWEAEGYDVSDLRTKWFPARSGRGGSHFGMWLSVIAAVFIVVVGIVVWQATQSSPALTPGPSSAVILTSVPVPAPLPSIAFRSYRSGNYDIYLMDIDGTNQRNLTNDPAADSWPAWSPDSESIAFQTNRDGNLEVYVMNGDGTDQHNLTYNPAEDVVPSWSSDGRSIAFRSDRDGNWEIYAMDSDGTNQHNLTNNPNADNLPACSPDGKFITFTSDRDNNWEIYVMEADGTNQRRLTNNPADDDRPAWSPDGRSIIFQTKRDGNWEIYIMSADGTQQRNITSNKSNDIWPSWSSDGKSIIFTSDRDGNWEIFAMDADGTSQRNLTDNPAADDTPTWEPAPTPTPIPSTSDYLVIKTITPPNGAKLSTGQTVEVTAEVSYSLTSLSEAKIFLLHSYEGTKFRSFADHVVKEGSGDATVTGQFQVPDIPGITILAFLQGISQPPVNPIVNIIAATYVTIGEPPAPAPPVTFTLKTAASPSRGGSVSPSSGNYDSNTRVTLTAKPSPDYKFIRWSGDASGTNPTIKVTIDSDKSVIANFTTIQYTLTTPVSPPGSGSISPNGGAFDSGSQAILTAIPSSGWKFDRWGGALDNDVNPTTVTMSRNRKVTAYFVIEDTDGDGLTDVEEQQIGTNPNSEDTDNDGLNDYEEVKVKKTNPLSPDTDGDGVRDGRDLFPLYDAYVRVSIKYFEDTSEPGQGPDSGGPGDPYFKISVNGITDVSNKPVGESVTSIQNPYSTSFNIPDDNQRALIKVEVWDYDGTGFFSSSDEQYDAGSAPGTNPDAFICIRSFDILGGTITTTSDGAADGSLNGPQAKIIVEISTVRR